MSTATASITLQDFLDFPDDGMHREVVRGELKEQPMTVRNRWHSRYQIRIGHLLESWLERQSAPRGTVHGGEVGAILKHEPLSIRGIDVAYFSPEVAHQDSSDSTLLDGPPVLAVEILSPSDEQEAVADKVQEFQAAGVPLVWLVDPAFKTITVHRLDRPPELFNIRNELTAEPFLAGFRVNVSDIFVY